MTIDDEKKQLRLSAKKTRARAFADHASTGPQALKDHGLDFVSPAPGAVIAGFLTIRDEIDPLPLMQRLHDLGHPTALPVMEGPGKPLVFRAWAAGEPLEQVVWGIQEPPASAPAIKPDIVLVPLLAFNTQGYRLGYGGGFYDRSIAQLRAQKTITTIGIAFDEQKVDVIPHLDYDEPLDWMLTPSGPIRCRAT